METELAVLMVGGDILIGKLETIDGALHITKPMMMVLVRKADKVGVQFIKLLGDPSKVKLPKGVLWYTVEEKEVIGAYLKETTGLFLVH